MLQAGINGVRRLSRQSVGGASRLAATGLATGRAGLQRAGSLLTDGLSFARRPAFDHADLSMEMLEHKMHMDFFNAVQDGMRWAEQRREPPLDLYTPVLVSLPSRPGHHRRIDVEIPSRFHPSDGVTMKRLQLTIPGPGSLDRCSSSSCFP